MAGFGAQCRVSASGQAVRFWFGDGGGGGSCRCSRGRVRGLFPSLVWGGGVPGRDCGLVCLQSGQVSSVDLRFSVLASAWSFGARGRIPALWFRVSVALVLAPDFWLSIGDGWVFGGGICVRVSVLHYLYVSSSSVICLFVLFYPLLYHIII